MIYSNPAAYLLSGVSAQSTGNPIDTRNAGDRGLLFIACDPFGGTGYSGVVDFQVAHDSTAWVTHSTYSATATQRLHNQITGYFPYVRAVARVVYSAAGGTGVMQAFWAPMVK